MSTISMKVSGLGLCVILTVGAAQAEVAEEAWVTRYKGPGSGKDNAQALAVDAAGNAYVTGFSDSGGGNYDFATVKYDGNGNQVWVARYDGDAQGPDWVRALALDAGGNVFVTGSSAGEGTGFDFATVKYDAAGKQLWVRRYDGPSHGDDRVKAMGLDTAGNVYVTGDSAGEGGRAEAVTIRYGPDGDRLWATRSGSPGGGLSLAALVADGGGNVYVAGGTTREAGNTDYVTIKYDPTGKALWTAHRDWSANDDARFLALDSAGNAYVTGASLRYQEGPEKTGHEDIATVKYGPDGRELWTASFAGRDGANDVASALHVDPGGHAYVVGTIYGPSGGEPDGTSAEYITIKYDADGDQLWAAGYGGPGGTEDTAHAAALDAVGGVYVFGSERGGPDRKPWLVTVKFAPDGSGRWVARHEGMASGGAGVLVVDGAGGVWITGSDAGGQDYVTVKYAQSETTAARKVEKP